MPQLDEGGHGRLGAAWHRVAYAWDGFLDFILRDNILEVAIGLM